MIASLCNIVDYSNHTYVIDNINNSDFLKVLDYKNEFIDCSKDDISKTYDKFVASGSYEIRDAMEFMVQCKIKAKEEIDNEAAFYYVLKALNFAYVNSTFNINDISIERLAELFYNGDRSGQWRY